MLDIEKVKRDAKALTAAIVLLKRMQREPRQPRWDAAHAQELARSRFAATGLCALRARGRGRRHLHRFPWQRFADAAAFDAHLDALARSYRRPEAA